MLIKLLTYFFNILIGRLPEDKKKQLWEGFNKLLTEAVKAGAEGAIKGAMKK